MGDFAPVVYPFEDTGDDWSFMPLAARRALDRTGFRLSLDGWQSLSLDDRRRLVTLGADEQVELTSVEPILRRSAHPPTPIKPVPDPDPVEPPEQLTDRRPLDPNLWVGLRSLDRYAVVHVLRRSIAHEDPTRLDRALIAIMPAAARAWGLDIDARHQEPMANFARPSTIPPPAGTSRRNSSTFAVPPGVGASPHTPASPGVHRHVAPISQRPSAMPRRPSSPEFAAVEEAPRESIRRPSTTQAAVVAPPAGRGSQPPPAHVSTHIDESGHAQMVDVGPKPMTHRRATAAGTVRMRPDTALAVAKNDVPKGEVLSTARIAAILAAKRTSELIPLCHPVSTTKVEVHLDVEASSGRIHVTAVVEAIDRTGVEMEAIMAVSVASMTIYDMLKGIDRDIVIGDIRLLSKSGGRGGPYVRVGG